ncbi:RimK/LysX family protein [Spirosoma sp. SC4-14]|uniref:ATP-dependent zinc protease family protein n=1 Tax=Spirosoma sp. SC4-14 TaxID=3128900 RepID=UPI0030D5B3B6
MKPRPSKPKTPRPLQTIGMTDLVDFPDLALTDVQVKVDTGAYTSSLHCKDVRLVKSGSKTKLSFWLLGKTDESTRRFYTDEFSQRMIRNSFGVAEKRYVIKTRIILFGRIIRTEFTLADRENLKNPVLIGRKLLRNRFVVDVAQKNLSYQAKLNSRRPVAETVAAR